MSYSQSIIVGWYVRAEEPIDPDFEQCDFYEIKDICVTPWISDFSEDKSHIFTVNDLTVRIPNDVDHLIMPINQSIICYELRYKIIKVLSDYYRVVRIEYGILIDTI
jgi:hypothetical protein